MGTRCDCSTFSVLEFHAEGKVGIVDKNNLSSVHAILNGAWLYKAFVKSRTIKCWKESRCTRHFIMGINKSEAAGPPNYNMDSQGDLRGEKQS